MVKDLDKCLRECRLDYKVYRRKKQGLGNHDCYRFTVPKGTCKSRPRNGWFKYKQFLDKEISDCLMTINREQLLHLLRGIHLGDGCKDRTGNAYKIATGNKRFADRLQQLCVMNGVKCGIYTRQIKDYTSAKVRIKNPNYVLNIQTDTQFSTAHGSLAKTNFNHAKFSFESPGCDELVWCVSNDMGTLVTRRNGKVAILGNCRRHGSPNQDWDWEHMFHMTEADIAKARKRELEEKPEKEPIRCPECGLLRSSGNTCPDPPIGCGTRTDKRTRLIVQQDGKLVELKDGELPTKTREQDSIELSQKRWDGIFWSARKSKSERPMNFNQAVAAYKRKYKIYPPKTLKRMPLDPEDFKRKIRDISMGDLR